MASRPLRRWVGDSHDSSVRKPELEKIYEVINEAAATYKGVIPADCWKEPYMSEREF